jgi:hypothetical protein
MRKELSPSLEMVACDVCGRTILKGEHTEPYLVPDGSRRLVCDLCVRRAEGAGWLRESLHGDVPTAVPRAEPRRSLLTRLRRRLEERPLSPGTGNRSVPDEAYAGEAWDREPAPGGYEVPVDRSPAAYPGVAEDSYAQPAPAEEVPLAEAPDQGDSPADDPAPAARYDAQPAEPSPGEPVLPEQGYEEGPGSAEAVPSVAELPSEEPALEESLAPDAEQGEGPVEEEPPADPRAERRERRERRRLRDPRHVRAVPTNAEAKVERALEIFNLSGYQRTVRGLVRTLGQPWVTALPHADSTSEVTVVVAWELSWYQFRVDLGDSAEPVAVADKGHEVDEIDHELRRWNATANDDGLLELGAPA